MAWNGGGGLERCLVYTCTVPSWVASTLTAFQSTRLIIIIKGLFSCALIKTEELGLEIL